MKKSVYFFIGLFLPTFALAEDITPTTEMATTSYVQGAYGELDTRISALETNGTGGGSATLDESSLNVTGTGPFLSSIGIGDGGVINVTKGSINQTGTGPIITGVSATTDGNIDVTTAEIVDDGTGAVVTGISTDDDGNIAVTRGNVQIPVGSLTATTYADIWVQ